MREVLKRLTAAACWLLAGASPLWSRPAAPVQPPEPTQDYALIFAPGEAGGDPVAVGWRRLEPSGRAAFTEEERSVWAFPGGLLTLVTPVGPDYTILAAPSGAETQIFIPVRDVVGAYRDFALLEHEQGGACPIAYSWVDLRDPENRSLFFPACDLGEGPLSIALTPEGLLRVRFARTGYDLGIYDFDPQTSEPLAVALTAVSAGKPPEAGAEAWIGAPLNDLLLDPDWGEAFGAAFDWEALMEARSATIGSPASLRREGGWLVGLAAPQGDPLVALAVSLTDARMMLAVEGGRKPGLQAHDPQNLGDAGWPPSFLRLRAQSLENAPR